MDSSKKSTLINLGAITFVCVFGLVLAYVLFNNPKWLAGMSHKNHGVLVKPQVVLDTRGLVKLDPKSVQREYSSKLPDESLKRYWTFVTLSPSDCDNICVRNLQYQLRVRLAQGQHIYHVRVVYIVTDETQLEALLKKVRVFPDLEFALIKPAEKARFIAQFKRKPSDKPLQQQRIYLIDPPGHWMMYYDPYKGAKRDLTLPTGMRKDLSRLTKYSKFSYPNKRLEAEKKKKAAADKISKEKSKQ